MLRSLVRSQRGQSLVEFGLILPVLLILTLGAIDFGRVYFTYVSVTNAARNGADYAAANCDPACDADGIRNAVLADTADLPNTSPTNPQVTVVGPPPAAPACVDAAGNPCAAVTVRHTFTALFPWPGIIPSSVDVTRTVTARIAE